ncbi:MAG TPA: type III pantothenate kinase [Bryobacteraceae bacterium]|nr:type III pantothenate kinase [Bryobacteraceae bacterium]
MILALDVGNTNITIGLFDGDKLTRNWRLRTVRDQTSDEWGILLRNLFDIDKLPLPAVDGIIISSVVPPLDSTLAAMSRRYFNREPEFVTFQTNTGLKILYDNPREVGADRIVNSVAAFHRYGGPCVVVDLGTAITFDAVTADAEYLGGVICPGIGMSVQGLFSRTARLPLVDFREPEKLIGSNTVGSMQSGLYYGVIGMIDGIVERMKQQLGPDTKTIATGGHAELIISGSKHATHADPDLTLEGLRLIWQRAQS